MPRLTSELEVPCPCCGATLVFDRNLGGIVRTCVPERGDKPELSDAQRIVAEQAARREASSSSRCKRNAHAATRCRSASKRR